MYELKTITAYGNFDPRLVSSNVAISWQQLLHHKHVQVVLCVDFMAPGSKKYEVGKPGFDTATKTYTLAESGTRARIGDRGADVTLLDCHRPT